MKDVQYDYVLRNVLNMKDIKHEKDVRLCFCIAVIFAKDVPQSKFMYSER
jgi:hypothetical protein